jgi:hypothetical protein
VLVCCDAGRGLQLGLSLDVGGDWPGLVLQLALQNAGPSDVRLEALDALWWSDARGELQLPGPARGLRWLDPGPRAGIAARSVVLRSGLRASCAASLAAAGHAGLTLGFLGWREHAGQLQLEARDRAPVELVARSEAGFALHPGERALGERIWLGLDAADADGLAVWAERTGLELGARRHRAVSVWCTGPGASAASTLELARELRRRELPIDVIRVDAGFAGQPGDWLRPSPDFPSGLEPVASGLRELGLGLGVRLAPLAVSRHSELARTRRDWLLPGPVRTARGRVRVLDAAHEPVLAWLESLARELTVCGAGHLWLDDLWLGLLPARRPRRAAIYRRALEALRRGAGPDAFLAGLAAPFAASAGPLDALQLEAGEAPRRGRWLRALSGTDAPELRASLAGRLAHAECSAIRLDARDESALRTAAIHGAILGGNVCLAGVPDALPRHGWRLARRLVPPSGIAPRRLVQLPGAIAAESADGSRLIALRGSAAGLDFAGMRVFDAWRGLDLGGSGVPELEEGRTQLLRLTPVDGRARLTGSDLHLTAGLTELREWRSEPAGMLQLELALPGPRRGSLHVQLPAPDTPPVRVRVSFRDTLELQVG